MKCEYTAAPFWFWNGQITRKEIEHQLQLMLKAGVRQPIIHARHGLLTEYLSEDWFDKIKCAVDFCKNHDMKIWIYDENNWPSGNCSWTITKDPMYREKFLQFHEITLSEGEVYEFHKSDKNILNITAYAGDAVIPLKHSDENVSFLASEETHIWEVWVDTDTYEPIGKLCVDYMSKEAIREFLNRTHEKYYERFSEDFGNTILGFYMDETRFCNAMPWTETFRVEFEVRKGYDILPLLPLLRMEQEEAWKVRCDYYDVVSALMLEATYMQIYDWCENHGVQTTGHFLGEETLCTQAYFMGDMMRYYQALHIPGIDHLGKGIGSLNAKFCVSAAHNYGRLRISSESFGGAGWDMGYEDVVRINNWLFQQGVTMIIIHGFYYSTEGERKNDWPPSYFFQWSDWDKFSQYECMTENMSQLLSDTLFDHDVLILSPMESYFSCVKHNIQLKTYFKAEGPWIEPDEAKHIDFHFQILCNSLSDSNIGYSILNTDAIENFVIQGNRIVNLLTKESYGILVLPLISVITEKTAELLEEFCMSGGIVLRYLSPLDKLFGTKGNPLSEAKEVMLQFNDLQELLKEIKKRVRQTFYVEKGPGQMTRMQSAYPQRLIDPYMHDGEQLVGVGISSVYKERQRIINITNYNPQMEKITMVVDSISEPEIYDPECDTIVIAEVQRIEKDRWRIHVEIPVNRSRFVLCEKRL